MRNLLVVVALMFVVVMASGCATVGEWWGSPTVQEPLYGAVDSKMEDGLAWVGRQVAENDELSGEAKATVIALLESAPIRAYLAHQIVDGVNDTVERLVSIFVKEEEPG